MSAHSDIDVRMKQNYEHPYRIYLTRRVPVIVRIDGKAFHTFTRRFNKPFDEILIVSMQDTMKYLCENIMGCKLGYTQSDEISLLLIDYDTFGTQPYFDYNIQKIASVCASMATLEFNRSFINNVVTKTLDYDDNNVSVDDRYRTATKKGAMFDARCFNVPREEVTNYFYSRQLDASRNSVEMVGRAYFSDKQLYKKSTTMIQDMLHDNYDVNWNNFPTEQKRGSCCIRRTYTETLDNGDIATRSKWIIDHEIPQFKGDNREYIEKYVNADCK